MEEQNKHLQRALNYGYFYLKFRPRTVEETRRYLHEKGRKFYWPAEIPDKAIASLLEQNYLNDSEFIKWFVTGRNKSKQKGQAALRQELYRLGVERDLIDEYFLSHEQDETGLADVALAKRWSRFASLDPKTRFAKAASFLQRRGFSFDTIKKTIAHLEGSR